MKKAKKISAPRDRYAFAYYCAFWNIIRLEEGLTADATPEETAAYIRDNPGAREKYGDFALLTYPYEDIRYGGMTGGAALGGMIDSAEALLKKIL